MSALIYAVPTPIRSNLLGSTYFNSAVLVNCTLIIVYTSSRFFRDAHIL